MGAGLQYHRLGVADLSRYGAVAHFVGEQPRDAGVAEAVNLDVGEPVHLHISVYSSTDLAVADDEGAVGSISEEAKETMRKATEALKRLYGKK